MKVQIKNSDVRVTERQIFTDVAGKPLEERAVAETRKVLSVTFRLIEYANIPDQTLTFDLPITKLEVFTAIKVKAVALIVESDKQSDVINLLDLAGSYNWEE